MLDPKSPGICTFDSTIFYHITKGTIAQNALSIQNTCNCFVNPRADLFTGSFRLKNRSKATVGALSTQWPPRHLWAPRGRRLGVLSLLSHPRKLLPQCLRMNHLTTRPCEMMGPATPELGKGPWHLRGAIFWGVRVTCCKGRRTWGQDKLCCWRCNLWLPSCCLKRQKILCNRKQAGSCPSVSLLF